jgi:FtsZ-interacting cell division protein ZipA
MKHPRKYIEPIITLSIALAVAIAFIALYTAITSQNVIINRLEADNSKQTLILCKLFLSDSTTLKQDDVAKVETICKEKIKQAANTTPQPTTEPSTTTNSEATQAPQTSSTPSTPVQPQNQPSTPQNKPQDNPKPTPPDNDGVIINVLGNKIHVPSPL